ncbi:MAG TPA: hypothetical protein VJL29_05930 [Thermoguttaceae bacterium]|nr:hypothetical protein [Thermoguttaceae bacterium]
MSRRGFWTDRSTVYVVRVCEDFKPLNPWNVPESFSEGRMVHKNVHLEDARAVVRTMNKRAIELRSANVEAWDRQWAIAVACVRSKCLDYLIRVPSGLVRPPKGMARKPDDATDVAEVVK